MSQVSDPYEELAALFLTDAESGGAGRPAVSLSAPVEVALVGHLPVMGGLWITQYADHVARQRGPTALVRLERGQVTVELLRASGPRPGLESVASLDEALRLLAAAATHWILCPQGEAVFEGPFPGDSLTLLTGGDEAATVAAYRIVKSLAERWHHAGWPVPPIGLVVLGAPPDRVVDVAEKLDRTTKAFLDVDLRVATELQRMDAIESAGRRTFSGAEMSIVEACRRVRLESGPSFPGPQRPIAPSSPRGLDAAVDPSPLRRPPAAPLAPNAEHGARQHRAGPSGPDRRIPEPVTVGRIGSAPRRLGPERRPERFPERELVEPRLNRTLRSDDAATSADGVGGSTATRAANRSEAALPTCRVPGLLALPLNCPVHPAVALAADGDGCLHLIVDAALVGELRPAEAWARAHRSLLALAFPQLAERCQVVSHVVGEDPPAMAGLHGTGLRLHAEIRTPLGEVVVVPLNRPSDPG
jgi:hypothetical protein